MIEPPDVPAGFAVGPPDFVGVGAQKAGTSWWFELVAAHPDVYVAADVPKEVQYFQRFCAEPFTKDDIRTYWRYFPRPAGRKVTGEWTPRYLHDFWTVDLLQQAAPKALILVLLRDPIERYQSGVTQTVFAQEKAGRRESAADAPRISPIQACDALHHGLYCLPVSRWVKAYGRKRVLVLQYERCTADPEGELNRTFDFLGVKDADFVPPGIDRPMGASRMDKVDVPGHVQAALQAYYEDDVRRLAKRFPEIDLSLWPNFAHLA